MDFYVLQLRSIKSLFNLLLSFILIFLVIVVHSPVQAGDSEKNLFQPKRIVFIDSYHQDYDWSAGIVAGAHVTFWKMPE